MLKGDRSREHPAPGLTLGMQELLLYSIITLTVLCIHLSINHPGASQFMGDSSRVNR